jgi:hypothetical protein
MTADTQANALPIASKVLCVVYALIAIFALITMTIQSAPYFSNPGAFVPDFQSVVTVTPASRMLTADVLMFCLAAVILMVLEARKHGVRFVWLYILGAFAVAISVAFPLFLIARELRIGKIERSRVGTLDAIGLMILAALLVGVAIWSGATGVGVR